MYVRATRISAAPDRIPDLITSFTRDVVPAVRKLTGNRGAVMLVDRKNGVGLGLTYWENEAALKASEEPANGLRSQAVQSAGGKVENVDRFEQVIMERKAEPKGGVFARVNDLPADPAKVGNAIALLGDKALPILQQQKGFRAYIVGVNRSSGRAIITSVWDTLEDLEASGPSVKDLRDEVTRASGASSVKVETFEAAFVELQVGATTG
jgi:heme-degrading monooxygenase HmoA